MKADIDKDGYLRIDAQSLVQSLPDAVLRDVAKYALFDRLVLDGIIGALVDGQMWGEDDEQPWWFDQETFTTLRLKLLPLLPAITAEAVRYIERQERQAKAEKLQWEAAAWKLWHAWPDRSTGPGLPSFAYERQEAITKEQAEAHLRGVEKRQAQEAAELAARDEHDRKSGALMGVLVEERDAYRAMLCDLLASAHPHPTEHPTMAKQWARARELLKNGPLPSPQPGEGE